MSWILGVNYSHDRSACLIKDGKVVVAIEEERLDRIKHSIGFLSVAKYNQFTKVTPMKSINYCLEAAGISIDELDMIVTNSALLDKSGNIARTEIPIRDKSKIMQLPSPSHHLAHAYSGYYASNFDSCAVLVIDSYGSFIDEEKSKVESESFFLASDNKLEKVNFNFFNYNLQTMSLGLFYNYYTTQLNFSTPVGTEESDVFNGYAEAGKTMGLSAYGKPRLEWEKMVNKKDGLIEVSFDNVHKKYNLWRMIDKVQDKVDYTETFYKDIAYKVQDEMEEALLYLCNELHKATGQNNLCIVGGVGLNAVANRKILDNTQFENIFILPAANDAGIALGCAYYGYYKLLNGKERHPIDNCYFGRKYDEGRIISDIKKYSAQISYRKTNVKEVANIISKGKIIGWVQGGSEFGPRALGHRSILADPRIASMKEYLNEKVKFREAFRPYAPSVLYEYADEYFDIDREYPYMIMVAPVKEDKKKVVPAIVHEDGTARIQTVTEKNCKKYYSLINEFYKVTGVPVLLNTSFNKQEPIVETPEDAINTFLRTNLDYLVIEDYLIERIK